MIASEARRHLPMRVQESAPRFRAGAAARSRDTVRIHRERCAALALLCLLAVGCDRVNSSADSVASNAGKPVVFVTLLPQAYFVERIAGTDIDVRVLIGQGQSEHSYEPTPQQMVSLASARAYFQIGVASETRVLEQIRQAYPAVRIVDTRAGIELIPMQADDDHSHEHGEAHDDHDHAADGGRDPHIWLNPQLVKTQARTIAAALSEIKPASASDFRANLERFESDLDRADDRISARLAPFKGREWFVFHPSFGYFARRYGLVQAPVEVEGKSPTPREIERHSQRMKRSGQRVVFCQPQFSCAGADAVARAVGGRTLVVDPLARDYLNNLFQIAELIATAMDEAIGLPSSAPASRSAP